ncbi:hypothetical protein ACJRO7_000001, partial [Eucalyptus globulus]
CKEAAGGVDSVRGADAERERLGGRGNNGWWAAGAACGLRAVLRPSRKMKGEQEPLISVKVA